MRLMKFMDFLGSPLMSERIIFLLRQRSEISPTIIEHQKTASYLFYKWAILKPDDVFLVRIQRSSS